MSLKIGYWNVGGIGNHGWDPSVVTVMADGIRRSSLRTYDIILLSETRSLDPVWLESCGFTIHRLKPRESDKNILIRGLMILRRNSIRFVENSFKHDRIGNFEYAYIDVLYSDVHRIVLTYCNDEKENLKGLKSINEILEPTKERRFVHLFGDNNSEDVDTVQKHLPPGFKYILDPSWTTNLPPNSESETKIDHVFSATYYTTLKTHTKHVLAREPLNPYEMVKRVNTSEKDQIYKMQVAEDKRSVIFESPTGTTYPSNSQPIDHPTSFHKIVVVEIGNGPEFNKTGKFH